MPTVTIYIGRRNTHDDGRPLFGLRRERPGMEEPCQYLASLVIAEDGNPMLVDEDRSNTRNPEAFYRRMAEEYARTIGTSAKSSRSEIINGKRYELNGGIIKDCIPLPGGLEGIFIEALELELGKFSAGEGKE